MSSYHGLNGNVVGVHFKIGNKIGEGSFGIIFEGLNLVGNERVAIKFESRKTDAPQLKDEFKAYKILSGCVGVPNVYHFGQEGLHNILIIDLLGPSLEDLFEWCGRKFSVKTTILVAKQMISRVQSIHGKSLIYRDIKPDNFLIGLPNTKAANLIHIVDFGMAKYYRDPKTKQHITYRERKSLSGTARYMSINTHLGREQSRRDDLESLGHVFMYFLRGSLPWQGLKAPNNRLKYDKICEKKQSTSLDDLCGNFPNGFHEYLAYTRNLRFDETPDYEYLIFLMDRSLQEIGAVDDGHYDWMDLNDGKGWDYSINKKPNLHGYGNPNPRKNRQQHRSSQNQQALPSNTRSKSKLTIEQVQPQKQYQQQQQQLLQQQLLPQQLLLQQSKNPLQEQQRQHNHQENTYIVSNGNTYSVNDATTRQQQIRRNLHPINDQGDVNSVETDQNKNFFKLFCCCG